MLVCVWLLLDDCHVCGNRSPPHIVDILIRGNQQQAQLTNPGGGNLAAWRDIVEANLQCARFVRGCLSLDWISGSLAQGLQISSRLYKAERGDGLVTELTRLPNGGEVLLNLVDLPRGWPVCCWW
jgi:hypothetical protein